MQVTEVQGFNPQELISNMRTQALTEDQIAATKEILAKYDPENFSNADRAAMRKDMRTAALPPSQELFQMIEDSGFTKPVGKGALRGGVISNAARNKHTTLMESLQAFRDGKISDEEFAIEVERVKDQLGVSIGEMIDNTIG
jgi:hypothetical protein